MPEDLQDQGGEGRTHEDGPQGCANQDDEAGEVTGQTVPQERVQRRKGQMSHRNLGTGMDSVCNQEGTAGS